MTIVDAMWFRILLPSMLIFMAAPAFASDQADIESLISRYAAARDTLSPDKAAIESLFLQDADQLVSSGIWRRGREELVRGMMRSSRNNRDDRRIEVEAVRLVMDDVAVVDTRYVIGERKMWSTFVVLKSDDGWRIAAIRNMKPVE